MRHEAPQGPTEKIPYVHQGGARWQLQGRQQTLLARPCNKPDAAPSVRVCAADHHMWRGFLSNMIYFGRQQLWDSTLKPLPLATQAVGGRSKRNPNELTLCDGLWHHASKIYSKTILPWMSNRSSFSSQRRVAGHLRSREWLGEGQTGVARKAIRSPPGALGPRVRSCR